MDQPFEKAVEKHGITVLKVCRAVLGPGADAEDAWSETFLSALQAWPELESDANVEAWLVRIAQRKAIDVTRKRHRIITTDEPPSGQRSEIGIPGNSSVEIWLEVAQLPERQRLALAYHYLGGLPHAETAELIGGTAAAVRRAAADGIASLRKRLNTPNAQPAQAATRRQRSGAAAATRDRGRNDARETRRTEL